MYEDSDAGLGRKGDGGLSSEEFEGVDRENRPMADDWDMASRSAARSHAMAAERFSGDRTRSAARLAQSDLPTDGVRCSTSYADTQPPISTPRTCR
jgi:hypothetical protein